MESGTCACGQYNALDGVYNQPVNPVTQSIVFAAENTNTLDTTNTPVPNPISGALGSTDPSNTAFDLVYSQTPALIAQTLVSSNLNVALTFQQTLTLDGNGKTRLPLIPYGPTGQGYVLNLQSEFPVTFSGLHTWSVSTEVDVSGGGFVTSITTSGTITLLASTSPSDSDTPFGKGQTLRDMDYLIPASNGVTYVAGSGLTTFFKQNMDGSYTSPASDPGAHDPLTPVTLHGTLKKLPDNSFTFTDTHQNVEYFDSDGKLLRKANSHNVGTTYTYSSGKLSGIQSSDGTLFTFTYSGDYINTVAGPNGTTTLTNSSGNLTGVQRPDGTMTTFAYDSGKLIGETSGDTVTTFSYDSVYGQLTGVEKGGGGLDNQSSLSAGVAPALSSFGFSGADTTPISSSYRSVNARHYNHL